MSRSAALGHDRGVLAAHLDDERPRNGARRVVAHQLQPDFLRAGEHDAVNALVVDQFLAHSRSGPGDEVEHAARKSGFNHELVEPGAYVRRIARRLEDDGVSGRQRATCGPGGERGREIERGDYSPDAVRPQHADVVFARTQRSHLLDEAVVRFDLIAVVRHQIRGLFDIAHTFETILADFVAHERRQVRSMLANGIHDFADVHQPLLPGQRGPRRIGRTRRRHSSAHVISRALLEMSEQDARINRTAIVELLFSFDELAVDIEEMFAAECLRRSGDRFVERAVQIVERFAAKRRVGDFGRHIGPSSAGLKPCATELRQPCSIVRTDRRRPLIDNLAVEDRDRHFGVANRLGPGFEDVVGQDHDVGEHAAREGAFALLVIRCIRSVARIRVDGVTELAGSSGRFLERVARIE